MSAARPPNVFENAEPQTPRRWTALELLFASQTIQHLAARSVSVGWRCLEVGGGVRVMKRDTRGKAKRHADRVQYHHPLPVAARRARRDRLLARENRQPPPEFFDHLDSGPPPEADA